MTPEPNSETSEVKPREFFVCELLNGELYIFREYQSGRTKFIEHSAYISLAEENAKLKKEIQEHIGIFQDYKLENSTLKQSLADTDKENDRLKILFLIADELITNENAKKDWEDAKQNRIM